MTNFLPDPYTWHDPLVWFYRDVLEWVEGGKLATNFHPLYGLCSNGVNWEQQHPLAGNIEAQLMDHFAREGLDVEYPFNNGSGTAYSADIATYTNPLRLAWIREHAKL